MGKSDLVRSLAAAAFLMVLSEALAVTIHASSIAELILWGCVGVFGSVAVLAHYFGSRRRGLLTRARELSREMLSRYARYKQRDPEHEDPEWAARSQRNSNDLMTDYDVEFSARALALFEALAKAKLIGEDARSEVEHPTNPLGFRQVAQRFGAIGEQL